MPVGALVGLAAFVVLSLAIGFRLFALWRQGGGVPELALAIAFTFSGGIGASLQVVRPLEIGSEAFQSAAWAMVRFSMDLGICCQVLFTWKVFSSGSRRMTIAFSAFVTALGAVLVAYWTAGALGDPLYRGLWFFVEALLHLAGLSWSAAEPLRYYARMRKRVRLGLADPVLANRFLVWAIAVSAAAGAVAVPVAFEALGLENQTLLIAGISATFALGSAIGYALTFFPPRAYRRLVERRAGSVRS